MDPIPFSASINGQRYDTTTALLLADDATEAGRLHEGHRCNRFLFRTQLRGLYFVLERPFSSAEPAQIEPLTREEAIAMWDDLLHRSVTFDEAFPSGVIPSSDLKFQGRGLSSVGLEHGGASGPGVFEASHTAEDHAPSSTEPALDRHSRQRLKPAMRAGRKLEPSSDDGRRSPSGGGRPTPEDDGSPLDATVSELPRCGTADDQGQRVDRTPEEPAPAPTGVREAESRASVHDQAALREVGGDKLAEPSDGMTARSPQSQVSAAEPEPAAGAAPDRRAASPPATGSTDGEAEPHPGVLWVDEDGEWQVEGVLRHRSGRVRLEGGRLVISTSGVSGRLRRTPWATEDSYPLDHLECITLTQRAGRKPSVQIALRGPGGETSVTLEDCRPAATLRQMIEALREAVPALVVDGLPVD